MSLKERKLQEKVELLSWILLSVCISYASFFLFILWVFEII